MKFVDYGEDYKVKASDYKSGNNIIKIKVVTYGEDVKLKRVSYSEDFQAYFD